MKVVENSQRDINIAFMNEIAMICDRMHIDFDEATAALVNGFTLAHVVR